MASVDILFCEDFSTANISAVNSFEPDVGSAIPRNADTTMFTSKSDLSHVSSLGPHQSGDPNKPTQQSL